MLARFKGARPSPALIISLVALFVSLGGVGVAAVTITGKNVKNSSLTGKDIKNSSLTGKDVKNSSLSGADIKNNSLTGSDVNESKLGKVPNAVHADSADNASHASSASNATSASTLSGLGASAFQHRVRWALIDGSGGTTGSGTILAQSGGITADDNSGNTNFNYLDFGESVAGKLIVTSVEGINQGQITGSPCGGSAAPGGSSCAATGTDDTNHVIIRMRSPDGSAGASFTYFVAVTD
jgi:hypothetical protein